MRFCRFCVRLRMQVASELGHGAVLWQGNGSWLEEPGVLVV